MIIFLNFIIQKYKNRGKKTILKNPQKKFLIYSKLLKNLSMKIYFSIVTSNTFLHISDYKQASILLNYYIYILEIESIISFLL